MQKIEPHSDSATNPSDNLSQRSATETSSNAVEQRSRRVAARGEPPRLKTREERPGVIGILSDGATLDAALAATFGCTDAQLARRWLGLLYSATSASDLSLCEMQTNEIVSAMHAMEPINEVDGMTAAQMLGCFESSMVSLRMAKQADTGEQRSRHLNEAQKLMKTYAQLAELRLRLQGKTGQQTVKVEHVHVGDGGQAVVGVVAS